MILQIIGEGLALIRTLLDPDKREKSFYLAIRKDAKKALDTAEEIFFLVDTYLDNDISTKKFKKRYNHLKQRFNNLD